MNIINYCDDKETEFDKLSLANPQRLPGGAYFSKVFMNNDNNFIFQTPKCITKNGIVRTNKKTYTDLLFTNDNHKFIEWVEKLEQALQYLIYEKRELWFHNDMGLEDIEYFSIPSIRVYKNNKFLFRSYIQTPKHIKDAFTIQIYDEDENNLTLESIKKDQKVICILEVLGIKFTSQSFCIEYCLRQMMVINEMPIFSKCLIKRKPLEEKVTILKELEDETPQEVPVEVQSPKHAMPEEEHMPSKEEHTPSKEEHALPKEEPALPKEERTLSKEETVETPRAHEPTPEDLEKYELIVKPKTIEERVENYLEENKKKSLEENTFLEKTPILKEFKDVLKKEHLEKTELQEIDIGVTKDTESVKLKKPNDVYYEIYCKAKKKAKDARQKAIEAFLEVKRIKNTYLLNEIDSTDDSDDESFAEYL